MLEPAELVGIPFVYGGRSTVAFDCYGLVMHILREKHDLNIPDFRSSASHDLNAAKFVIGLEAWQVVPPAPGAVIAFRIGKHISHCGYMLDALRMIHTWDKSGGVVIERIDAWKQRIIGFYRYVGH